MQVLCLIPAVRTDSYSNMKRCGLGVSPRWYSCPVICANSRFQFPASSDHPKILTGFLSQQELLWISGAGEKFSILVNVGSNGWEVLQMAGLSNTRWTGPVSCGQSATFKVKAKWETHTGSSA